MANKIFYFSGTGNSLKVAKDIASEIKAELIPIKKAIGNEIDGDTIGIVFPVYMWMLPNIVAKFVSQIKSKNYIYCVATYGGAPGMSLLQAKKILDNNGATLSAGFGIKMPGNFAPLYGAKPLDSQKKLFDKEKEKIELIVETVKNKKTAKIACSNFIFNAFVGAVFAPMMKKMRDADKKFVVEDSCTSCGTCEKVCPVKNIKLVDKKPVWQHHCEQCMACLQWSPVEAIQVGKSTKERKRYHHPEIKLNEITR
jgi:ferredoxin